MIAAHLLLHHPPQAKLLVIDARGEITHFPRAAFVDFLRPGDLVVANDAATLPASLQGEHVPTGSRVEVRLAGRRSLAPDDVRQFAAIVFGEGDHRTRTEDRPPPPRLEPGDRIWLGPLAATVERLLLSPRFVSLRFEGTPDAIWSGLARHGRPIQYAHVPIALALWDVWTSIAGPPVAFEPPSAAFALDWNALSAMRSRGVAFATLTHAAGISSTGDDELDRCLPFDEPYDIPTATAAAICRCGARRTSRCDRNHRRACSGARGERRRPGASRQRTGDAANRGCDRLARRRRASHRHTRAGHQSLRVAACVHRRCDPRQGVAQMTERGYRSHEFGDSVLIERKSTFDERESRDDCESGCNRTARFWPKKLRPEAVEERRKGEVSPSG